jgi:hypothetical protein
MTLEPWPRGICIVCKERRAEPMTYVCKEEKCFQTFMEYQFKGRLKELLGIYEGDEEGH